MKRQVLALESRLRSCRNVLTVGVRPNFGDYTEAEARLIHDADKIYYPSAFYAEHFEALGKAIFPSCHSYRCAQDKIKQSTLFQLAGLPHPRTRVFYGRRQQAGIQDYFSFPLIAKDPRGSAMGRGVS
ncbi:hypothetical protein [Desulfosarcina cetonica]|uniref:hypothetical protein n=1 Tax=Desulfosarcina cetonica TaxID=90730 RepID=UPI0006D22064|nr:hypothetical protein [Desulfosarcina cetonica]